ncbi:MAG: coenzyme F420-0:L-glutamate ligase [Acidimicrobiales bacterium]|nr:coenzyme F420-0:L-glutamate ligase [Acidimicrobiales bacterium]
MLEIIPVEGLGEVTQDSDIADLIMQSIEVMDFDVLVVTQKIVSKQEGLIIKLNPSNPEGHKRQIVEDESVAILRRRGDLVISETHHGFVCANAGVDLSNVPSGTVALLPKNPDLSAKKIMQNIKKKSGKSVGVIISDTFGRPWRRGLCDVAIGVSGIAPVVDWKGKNDANGREMQVTEVCIADELASAAELVMPKDSGIPVAIVRGVDKSWFQSPGLAKEIIRNPNEDLFR